MTCCPKQRLLALLSQERTAYKTIDYLEHYHQERTTATEDDPTHHWSDDSQVTRSPKRQKNENEEPASTTSSSSSTTTQLNRHWREKICEWSYQGEKTRNKGRDEWSRNIQNRSHPSLKFLTLRFTNSPCIIVIIIY